MQAMVGASVIGAVGAATAQTSDPTIISDKTAVSIGVALATVGALVSGTWWLRGVFDRINSRQDAGDVTDAQMSQKISDAQGKLLAHDETLIKHHERISNLEARSNP